MGPPEILSSSCLVSSSTSFLTVVSTSFSGEKLGLSLLAMFHLPLYRRQGSRSCERSGKHASITRGALAAEVVL